MRSKIIAPLVILATAFVISACNQTENSNSNTARTNANSNANANGPIASTTPVPNTNDNSRRAPTREDYERDKDKYSKQAKDTGRKVGTGVNDGWLWVKTRFDLAAVDDLRDSTINVDVDNAVVTLTGTVATQPQIAKADETAKAVEGVKGVKNMLKVAPNVNANTNTAPNTNKAKTK
ncbi:MAG TPA: BON domain-containing protein [Pyrinomonadaceae bacterium]